MWSERDDHNVALVLKSLPATQEAQVPSLGREDPLEENMATHSSILACRIPWMEKSGGLQSMGSQSDRTEATQHTHMYRA